MRALVLQHIAIEGPGILAPLLRARGWEVETMLLYTGTDLPERPRDYQAIIVMGGPMSVHDDAAYPFLGPEHDFLQRAIAQEVPMLGICLGSQLLAKALGARVYRNARKEVGWYQVDLTGDGIADPLFAGVTSPVRVLQWHGDAFDLPAGACQLATSADCANQAFRYRDRVYGLLFHLELTPVMIRTWLTAFSDELSGLSEQVTRRQIEAETVRYTACYARARKRVFANLIDRLWEPLACRRPETSEP